MSGYHRISKLKTYISSINNFKNIRKINENLGKEINAICSKSRDSNTYFDKIKDINQVLTKEFSKISADAKSKSKGILDSVNVSTCKNKLKESCKTLHTVCDKIEEKKNQYKCKSLKTRYIKKEAEKLCQYLSKHKYHGTTLTLGAAGLSITEVPASLTENIAGVSGATNAAKVLDYDFSTTVSSLDTPTKLDSKGESQATTIFDTADSASDSIKNSESINSATVLDTYFENLPHSAGVTDAIPEPPPIPDVAAEALNQLNALGEPTFASLGLGGWTPVGIVQQCMEYLHVTLGIDWWAAIVLGTLFIRICMFPLVILAQRNSAKMHNYMPQMQVLQMKMTEARQTGDSINAARYGQEMMLFMNEKGLSPFKNMIVPLAQAPIFISFFMGLRQMANVPVESLTHGGLFWFEDLTLPDQYFLMPIITSTTLWLTIEIGTDAAKLSSQNMGVLKYVLRAIPVVILPFTVNFPGAILCYWVSTNFISLAQVAFLRIPKVRTFFNIEQMVKHKAEDLPKPKGFTAGIKDSWTNIKITKELEDRRRMDEIQFQRAGKGPIQKTFKYDPTKQTNPSSPTPISAKKR